MQALPISFRTFSTTGLGCFATEVVYCSALDTFSEEALMRRTGLIAAGLLVLSMTVYGQSTAKAPSLTLKTLQGHKFTLRQYRGKVVLLNFWATWCPPCRAEMPDLIKMQRDYRSKGLQVIGVTYPPEEIREVRQFIRKLKVNYPIAVGTKETKALFDETETLPLTVVIDRQGNVRERIEGILLAEEFEQKIKPLLK
jgi:thiol-disulfide isomerase/thioredoxin